YALPNLCSNVPTAQVDLIYDFLEKRVPNRAPTYRAVELWQESDGTNGTIPRVLHPGEVVRLRPGESIVLRGRPNPDDLGAFQLIDDNCQLQALREVLAWSWFTNIGEISTRVTTESMADAGEDSSRHRTTYSAPRAADVRGPTAHARIWSILRDGR